MFCAVIKLGCKVAIIKIAKCFNTIQQIVVAMSTNKQKYVIKWEKKVTIENINNTYTSIKVLRKGAAFSMPSMLASDCTNAMGIMKKNVMKKKATATISLLIVSDTYGIAMLSQYTSRGSGAHSVNHIVGFLVC